MELKKGNIDKGFWKGKKVFLTGHTGFKGSWLSLWLLHLGVNLKGYSLRPSTNPSLYDLLNLKTKMDSEINDIRDFNKLSKSLVEFNPDIVIHMAAQPLVRKSYLDPIETYSTNVMGTVNLYESAKECSNLKSIVSITTDKCYENKEWVWGYREYEPMGGHDPYSSSKGCAELVTSAYRRSYFHTSSSPSLASARAGNVIGGGDWSQDRLIPDILRAFEKSESVKIRNPQSVRPWQHVLEPLSGYLNLAEKLYVCGDEYAEAWNFGPRDQDCKKVSWILNEMVENWGNNASWTIDKGANPHEANFLKLDCSKAAIKLKWTPKLNLKTTIKSIVNWHKEYIGGANIQEICMNEINNYQNE